MTTELSGIELVEEITRNALGTVFKTMVSFKIEPIEVEPLGHDEEGQLVASVGFTGKITGIIYLCVTANLARSLAARMLSQDEKHFHSHEMINDALGELSNMIVGRVKSHLCDHGLECVLSIPSIFRGPAIQVQPPSHLSRKTLAFSTERGHFIVDLFLKNYELQNTHR